MQDLKVLRENINSVDTEILSLFLKRMEISKEIAKTKAFHHLPIENKIREEEILFSLASNLGEMKVYTEELFKKLFCLSKQYQESILKDIKEG